MPRSVVAWAPGRARGTSAQRPCRCMVSAGRLRSGWPSSPSVRRLGENVAWEMTDDAGQYQRPVSSRGAWFVRHCNASRRGDIHTSLFAGAFSTSKRGMNAGPNKAPTEFVAATWPCLIRWEVDNMCHDLY